MAESAPTPPALWHGAKAGLPPPLSPAALCRRAKSPGRRPSRIGSAALALVVVEGLGRGLVGAYKGLCSGGQGVRVYGRCPMSLLDDLAGRMARFGVIWGLIGADLG